MEFDKIATQVYHTCTHTHTHAHSSKSTCISYDMDSLVCVNPINTWLRDSHVNQAEYCSLHICVYTTHHFLANTQFPSYTDTHTHHTTTHTHTHKPSTYNGHTDIAREPFYYH